MDWSDGKKMGEVKRIIKERMNEKNREWEVKRGWCREKIEGE